MLMRVLRCSLDMSDKDRLKTLLMMSAAEASAGLSEGGHRYAMTHAAGSLSPCAATRELLSGMTQVRGSDQSERCAQDTCN